jgi:MarR family transcriptional regulator, lower aerobic nicotinate degradation pathway regulator
MASYSLQDMYRRPGFLLKRCHQVSMAIFLDECREVSLTQSQYGCLRALEVYPGVDQIALGRLVGLDRSTAGMVIKTLSERRLIERVVNRRDKRRMRLKLSAAGKRLLIEIAPAAARAQARVLRGLPQESRTAFLDMLEAFLAGHDALIDIDDVPAGAPVPDREEPQRPSLARRSASRNSRRPLPTLPRKRGRGGRGAPGA